MFLATASSTYCLETTRRATMRACGRFRRQWNSYDSGSCAYPRPGCGLCSGNGRNESQSRNFRSTRVQSVYHQIAGASMRQHMYAVLDQEANRCNGHGRSRVRNFLHNPQAQCPQRTARDQNPSSLHDVAIESDNMLYSPQWLREESETSECLHILDQSR